MIDIKKIWLILFIGIYVNGMEELFNDEYFDNLSYQEPFDYQNFNFCKMHFFIDYLIKLEEQEKVNIFCNAIDNKIEKLVRLFLEKSLLVDFNIEIDNGLTPLIISSKNGWLKVVKLLLNGGAGVDRQAKSGFSPLLYACHNNHPNVVDLLLRNGANPNQIVLGDPLLIRACRNNYSLDIIYLLLDAGADPNIPSNSGDHLIMIAHQDYKDRDGIMELLKKYDAFMRLSGSNLSKTQQKFMQEVFGFLVEIVD